jgi:hypothetical protein
VCSSDLPPPQPQPQPAYAPQPQPGAAPATMGGGAAVGVGVGGAGGSAMPPVSPTVRLGLGTHFVLTADRLFGFHYWMASGTPKTAGGVPVTGVEASASGTQLAFLAGGSSTGFGQMQVNPYSVPRAGFDAVLNGGFSVGGSLIYFATSGTQKIKIAGTETSTDCPTISAVGFAPRAGFVIMFNDMIGIWPRLGFTYITSKTTTKTPQNNPVTAPVEYEDTQTFLSVDPEALLVISPVPHFGITIGLQASVGVAGTFISKAAGTTTDETDVKLTNIGMTCGLLGYF